MALATVGFQATVTFRDDRGIETTRTYYGSVADNTDYAGFSGAVNTMVGQLAGLTNSAIVKVQISEIQTDAVATPGAGTQVVEQAFISGVLSNGFNKANINIPSPDDLLFVGGSGGTVVSPTYAPLITWLGNFATGGNFNISDGDKFKSPVEFVGKYRSVNSGKKT